MFPDYTIHLYTVQLGQVKRDIVNTGFPKESKGILVQRKSFLQLAIRASWS